MKLLQRIHAWHRTRLGYGMFAAAELLLTIAFALWALNSGSLLEWAVTVILFVGFLQNTGRLVVYKK